MRRHACFLFAGLALAAWSVSVSAQDTVGAIVFKAMEAHGGKKLLSKYQAAQVKYKGTMEFMGAQAKMTGEVFFQFPHKMKNVLTMEINNMNIDVQTVFDGKAFYIKAAGQSLELKDEKLIEETKESIYAEKVASLADLDDKGYTFSAVGDVKVNGQEATGVRVSREGYKDVNLFFDKKSNLLVKYEFRGKEPISMMEVTMEKVVSEFKDVQGIKTGTKLVVTYDGKAGMEMEITDITYAERFDDSQFAKP